MNSNMLEALREARGKKKFDSEEEFKQILRLIKSFGKEISIDWDDGAGEEWARIVHQNLGVIGMIHTKIGMLFIMKNKELDTIKDKLKDVYIVEIEDFDKKEWFIKIEDIKNTAPELNWCAPPSAIDCNNFSLSDFYVITV